MALVKEEGGFRRGQRVRGNFRGMRQYCFRALLTGVNVGGQG
jgi:hypothetical protein